MGRLTLTAKEQRKKRDQIIKIITTMLVLSIITIISIWWVLNKDSNSQKNGVFDYSMDDSGENLKVDTIESGEELNDMNTNSKYAEVKENPLVTMEMEDGGVIKIELYPQIAPTTVENFISLIKKGMLKIVIH